MPKRPRALQRPDVKPIEEWDDEELQRGRMRSSAGTFVGRSPHIPPEVYQQIRGELNRRKLLKAADIIRDSLEAGVRILRSIIDDPGARDADKLKAAELLMDRAWGKAMQPIVVARTAQADKPVWELAVEDYVNQIDDEQKAIARRTFARHGHFASPEAEAAYWREQYERLRDSGVVEGTSHEVVDAEVVEDDARRMAGLIDEDLMGELVDEER